MSGDQFRVRVELVRADGRVARAITSAPGVLPALRELFDDLAAQIEADRRAAELERGETPEAGR